LQSEGVKTYEVVYCCQIEYERVEFVKELENWAAGKYLCERNEENDM